MLGNVLRHGARNTLSRIARGTNSTMKQRNHITQSNKVFVRNGGGGVIPPNTGYRCMPPDDPLIEMVVDTTMTLIWAYVFWNFYHHGQAAFSKGSDYHEYSDATDEELGI